MAAANVSLVENLPGEPDSEFLNYNLNEPQIMVGDSSGQLGNLLQILTYKLWICLIIEHPGKKPETGFDGWQLRPTARAVKMKIPFKILSILLWYPIHLQRRKHLDFCGDDAYQRINTFHVHYIDIGRI